MKKQMKTLPPCYKQQFSKRENEWMVKKSFYFTDINGKRHRTDTKWHKTIKECELEYSLVIESNGAIKNKVSNEPTIKSTLQIYIDHLKKEKEKPTVYKNSTARTKHSNTNALLTKYTPQNIADTKIKDIKPTTFNNWLTFINSDTSGHESLSGVRVRAFKTAIEDYIDSYLSPNVLITREKAYTCKMALKDVPLKPKKTGKRNNRNCITIKDLIQIQEYYKSKGIEKFENFYWYCFYVVLFCTGMRVGEIIALQWKNIEFSDIDEENIIHIVNSIGEREITENVLNRIRLNNLETKNSYSKRDITMWEYYRNLLSDYKYSYKQHFNYDDYEAMEDAFVFPNLTSTVRPYRTQKSTLVHTNNLMKKLGLPKTDNQMFRHGCAYYLAYEMNVSIEKAHQYFGHCDSKMLEQVYAPLSVEEKRISVSKTLAPLISDKEIVFKENKSNVNTKAGEELKAKQASSRKIREINQIRRAIDKGQKSYKYNDNYAPMIEEIMNEYPEFKDKIKFVHE